MSVNRYREYIDEMRNRLPLQDSFDLLERSFFIAGREAVIYYVDGLVERDNIQRVLQGLLSLRPEDVLPDTDSDTFLARHVTYLDAMTEEKTDTIVKYLYSGLIPLFIDGLDKAVVLDIRNYPVRSIQEPEKEKTLRGAKDGFCETFMSNIALIRRRLRDDRLVFKSFTVGEVTQTDVCIVYMKGIADPEEVDVISRRLKSLKIKQLTCGEQSLIEAFNRQTSGRKKRRKKKNAVKEDGGRVFDKLYRWYNPFPKVRYTQRPDVATAHIAEGKVVIIVDNTPTVIMIPSGILEFMQDIDDYYFPVLTGCYMRLLRIFNFLVITFISPVYLLLAEGHFSTPGISEFLLPNAEKMMIPVFWQLILLEMAVDGLKLASLNTPDSLGMSLSVIGALLLGDLSITSGWFVPQTILLIAVVAIASFTQPSIEIGYSIKFSRILMLIGVELFSLWGGLAALALVIIVIATTGNFCGKSYLYPLVPFDGRVLSRLIFRRSTGS